MFRRKDNEPTRPGATPDAKPDISYAKPVTDAKPAEPVRRQIDLPAPGDVAKAAITPEALSEAQGKRLTVGQGIRLSGEITACDRLVVEGTVEVTLNDTRAVEIARTGRFTGGCEVEEAEISGIYEGELTVRNKLLIRSTGRVKGTVRYGELEIERGGRLSGAVTTLEPSES